ncbi:MAG: pseudouridine-5'-phosphate glycosidase, partial [Angelakisella sp.]
VGIHRCDESCAQVSPEVQELTHTSVAVVCAGIKPALDIDMTLSYLRSAGVPIIGLGSDDFPAFYSRKSGFKVDFNAIDAETAAWILHTKWRLGLTGGALIANPMPAEFEPNVNDMEMAIRNALAAAKKSGVRGKSYSDRLNFSSDLELAYNNARVGAQLACEYVKAEEQCLNKE